MSLQQNDKIVFFGDSITDCGRNREATPGEEASWGGGYVYQIAAALSAELPDYELEFINKGISGNRIYDLEARLDADVLSHDPDVVSILIGINDVWRNFDSGIESEIGEFTAAYRRVLEKIDDQGAQIVILEPFLLPVPEDRKAWRVDLDPKIAAIRELAREFNAVLVPLDGIFAAASCKRESAFWAGDGVHPSAAGHALIANSWQEAFVD